MEPGPQTTLLTPARWKLPASVANDTSPEPPSRTPRRLRTQRSAFASGSGTSAWEVVSDDVRFQLLVSPEVYRGFSGEGQALEALNQVERGLASGGLGRLVDPPYATWSDAHWSDPMHFSREGSERFAELLAEALAPELGSPSAAPPSE